jgi:hypothetical protein
LRNINNIAKRQVPDLDLHLVKDTYSLDQLGWFRQRAKQRDEYFPCRKCPAQEGIGLFDDPNLPGHVLVRILGWNHPSTGTYQQIWQHQWQAFDCDDNNNKNNEDGDDEQKLRAFLDLNCTKNSFSDDPVGLKLEELAIRAQWEKVRERQEYYLANGGDDGGGDNHNEKEDLDPPCLQRRFSAETDEAEAVTMSLDMPRSVSKDNSPSNETTTLQNTAAKLKTEDKGLADESDDDPSDDDDDDDDIGQFTSPGNKKKEKLRDGDIIEYYDPIGVAGRDEWLRQATILGINPKNKHLPLNLNNGQSLDRHCLIKLLERRIRGNLVASKGSKFKPLKAFALQKCGTEELVALKRLAQHAKQVRQSHQDDVSKFWKTNGNETRESSRHVEEETEASTELKTRVPVVSQEEEEREPETPAWKIHLEGVLQSTREKMEKSKRFKPTMEPKQLELVLEVWSKLQQRMDRTGQTTPEVVSQLAHEVGLSLLRINTIMHGDTQVRLSAPNKIEVTEELVKWLDTAATKFIEAPFEPKLATPLRRKRRQSTATQPSTNRRKRHKQEMAQSINPIFNASSSSLSFSTPSRQGTGSVATTPASQQIRSDQISSAVASRKRRLTQSVDTHRTKSVARATKSRQTYTPSVETIRARGIFREAPTETLSKRKPARPAYEPPSVTRRRQRESTGLSSRSSTTDSDDTMPRKKQRRKSTAIVSSTTTKKVGCPMESTRSTLRSRVKTIRDTMKTKKRYKPHMTVDQLELALEFWDKVPAESKDGGAAFITKAALKLDVSHFKITRFLKGDSETKLGPSQLEDIHERIKEWIAEPTTTTSEVADDKESHDVTNNTVESEPTQQSEVKD